MQAKDADQGQRRTRLRQARSRETKDSLLRAAVALWRTKGFDATTVADICQAAGVSKALFFFYFPRKEDALLEAGFFSTRGARQQWRDLVAQPYELPDVVHAVLTTLERAMRDTPPELVVHATLEGYREEQRALAEGRSEEHHATRFVFLDLLRCAQDDGKLPDDLDVVHVARVVQTILESGVRHWASGEYGDRSFADVVGRDVVAFIEGTSRRA